MTLQCEFFHPWTIQSPGFSKITPQESRVSSEDFFAEFATEVESATEILNQTKAVQSQIDELAATTKEPNWDEEWGEPIKTSQWDESRSLVKRVMQEFPRLPTPFISPCGDGTVHLTWTNARGDRAVIEIGDSKYLYISIPIDGDDTTQSLRSLEDAPSLIQATFR